MRENKPQALTYLWLNKTPYIYSSTDPKEEMQIFLEKIFGSPKIDMSPAAALERLLVGSKESVGRLDLNFEQPYMQNEFGKLGWEMVSFSEKCSSGCSDTSTSAKAKGITYYKQDIYWYKRLAAK